MGIKVRARSIKPPKVEPPCIMRTDNGLRFLFFDKETCMFLDDARHYSAGSVTKNIKFDDCYPVQGAVTVTFENEAEE